MVENGDKTINLHPLWDALLQVYQVVADICNRHSLRYCASYGTALGAVRHGGFIPWDDDLDIQMPRPDYERFIEIAKKELPSGYAWLDRNNCRDFKYAFGKVIVTDKTVVERVAKEANLNLGFGIFIDIFPVDGFPESKVGILWRRFQNYLVSGRNVFIGGYHSTNTLKAKIAWIIGMCAGFLGVRFSTFQECADFWEYRARKHMFGSTRKCVSIGLSSYKTDCPFPASCWNNLKEIKFENINIWVFQDIHTYLTLHYGDYMKLPPEDKRVQSHAATEIVSWRFGPITGS